MTEPSQIQTWVNALAQGDQLAVAKLLAAFHPTLRARAIARMDPALRARFEPEDVLQQVYMQVIREIDKYENRGEDSFLRWVTTILDNKLIDARRAAYRQVRSIARELPAAGATTDSYWNLLDLVYAGTGTPSQAVRKDEALGALLACVSGLGESHRQVLQLRFLEGLPVGEVARRLGKTDGAVVALTKRALESLRKSMDHLGEFTHGG